MRAGIGTILVPVMAVLVILAILGAASMAQTSGTGRTYGRIVDTRLVLEAADAAILEAVVRVRHSLDTGLTCPECPDNWRALILASLLRPEEPPTGKKVIPRRCREVFRAADGPMTISDVSVDVVRLYCARPSSLGILPHVPQGVLEMSVSISGAQKLLPVVKRVRQRRVFFVEAQSEVVASDTFDAPSTILTLLSEPLGTVLE